MNVITGGNQTVMQLLRKYKLRIVQCICLILLLAPIAQSLACISSQPEKLDTSTTSVVKANKQLDTITASKHASCHSVQVSSDHKDSKQASVYGAACDGDCCNYCMITSITNDATFIESYWDFFYIQASIIELKPDFFSIPAIPPPIV